jgi:hypothetical protein
LQRSTGAQVLGARCLHDDDSQRRSLMDRSGGVQLIGSSGALFLALYSRIK